MHTESNWFVCVCVCVCVITYPGVAVLQTTSRVRQSVTEHISDHLTLHIHVATVSKDDPLVVCVLGDWRVHDRLSFAHGAPGSRLRGVLGCMSMFDQCCERRVK